MKVMDKGWKMKKRLVAFLLCCAAASSFAAFQFDYGSISAAHSDYGKDTYDAYADRAGRFGLQNAFYFNTGSYLYASFSKGAPEFGAYYLDGRNKGEEIRLADIGNGQYTAIGADGKALKFNAGDSIGFWTRDADGRTVYNTPASTASIPTTEPRSSTGTTTSSPSENTGSMFPRRPGITPTIR